MRWSALIPVCEHACKSFSRASGHAADLRGREHHAAAPAHGSGVVELQGLCHSSRLIVLLLQLGLCHVLLQQVVLNILQ